MTEINSIRDAVDAFRLFLEDKTGRLHGQLTYPPRLIYYYLNIHKNAAAIELSKKKGTKDLNIALTIPCMEFEELDMVECPCAPAKGCSFYKSIYPVPEMVGGKPLMVTTLDGYISYDFINWYDFKDKLNSRHVAERIQPYYAIKIIDNDRHIYLYSSDKVESPRMAAIHLVPYNPLDLLSIPLCSSEAKYVCSPLDEVFHISKEIETVVFDRTLQTLINFKLLNPGVDVINNDHNDAQAPMK